MAFENYEVWFVTEQLLYPGDTVITLMHSNEIVKGLNESGNLPVKNRIQRNCNSARVTAIQKAANNDENVSV